MASNRRRIRARLSPVSDPQSASCPMYICVRKRFVQDLRSIDLFCHSIYLLVGIHLPDTHFVLLLCLGTRYCRPGTCSTFHAFSCIPWDRTSIGVGAHSRRPDNAPPTVVLWPRSVCTRGTFTQAVGSDPRDGSCGDEAGRRVGGC